MPTETIAYLQPLIEFDSVSTRSNVPISDYVETQLRSLEFEIERIEYNDRNGVRKVCVVGRRGPTDVETSDQPTGGMAWFGHTDVVPADDWHSSDGPWKAVITGDRLYGRGSCDMKGPIACMLTAAARTRDLKHTRPLFITCTADEEIGYGGASEVARQSKFYREMVGRQANVIIGEPTLLDVVYAHKGSVGFRAIARGRAAHSSSSGGINANLAMIPFLQEMKNIHDEVNRDKRWHDHRFDPPTLSWNIGINDHTAAVNITPAQSVCTVYFRPMPGMDADELVQRSRLAAERCGLEFDSQFGGPPMFTPLDSPFVAEVLTLAERTTPKTVCYGTDGAKFGELKNRVVCGPGDIAQAHTRDEWIALNQLTAGSNLYERMIQHWCTNSDHD